MIYVFNGNKNIDSDYSDKSRFTRIFIKRKWTLVVIVMAVVVQVFFYNKLKTDRLRTKG